MLISFFNDSLAIGTPDKDNDVLPVTDLGSSACRPSQGLMTQEKVIVSLKMDLYRTFIFSFHAIRLNRMRMR